MGEVIYLKGAAPRPILDSEDVLRVFRPVAVYFMSYARNAWHSTWIKRYDPDHLFRDSVSVKKAVESRKWQGTVLRLDVLPAIQFDFAGSRFVLTEINTAQPFRNFQKALPASFLSGLTRAQFLYEIGRPGAFWRKEQSFTDSVILQQVNADYLDFWSAQLVGNPAKGYCSPSLPLKVGFYTRDVESDFWAWSLIRDFPGAPAPSLSGFKAAIKALTLSAERSPFAGSEAG